MELIEGRAILINVRRPERFAAVLTDFVLLGETDGIHELLVRWTKGNVETLIKLGLKGVPALLERDYHWPGAFTPMSHQKVTASFLVNHEKCFVFDETGVGKTASVAWGTDYMLQQKKINRVLIVCPLSIINAAWKRDLFNVVPHRSVGVAYGTVKTRAAVIAGKYEYVIINYDGIELVLDELLAGNFDCIVADECTALKNVQTARWKAFSKVAKAANRVVLMTGTPAAQSPEDAYGLAKLVNPAGVPHFAGAWKDLVMQKVSMFRWIPRTRSKDLVHRALQPAIRHTKEQCLDLPDMVYVTRDVPMTKAQEDAYKRLKDQMLLESQGEVITAVNAAAKLTKLLQISCGVARADDGSAVHFDVSPRLKELSDIIAATLHKVIVFAPFTHTIEMIEAHLNKEGTACAVINGEVPLSKRSKLITDFEGAADPRVLIIQPKAAAHGITLVAADTVVWFGPTTSVETFIQANARAYRKGQKNKVTVHMIQGSLAERKIYAVLNSKLVDHAQLIELYNEIMSD